MSWEGVHNVVRRRFFNELSASGKPFYSATGGYVAWDNATLDKKPTADDACWARCSVQQDDSLQLSLGADEIRTIGTLAVSIFVTANTGDKLALERADLVVAAFNRTTETYSSHTVTFGTPAVSPIGLRDAWYQVNVFIPFQSDNAVT